MAQQAAAEQTPNTHDHGHDQALNTKMATWLYLSSEVVLFSILIGGYALLRLQRQDLTDLFHDEFGVTLVTINTFLLLMSSWAMVMGLNEARKGNRGGVTKWIGLTALLGTIFVIGQYIEYAELAHVEIALGYIHPDFGSFGERFYAPTAFHGAHVVIGVIWALYILYRSRQGAYDEDATGIEIFGLYWHFVDVVWIILFTLIYLI